MGPPSHRACDPRGSGRLRASRAPSRASQLRWVQPCPRIRGRPERAVRRMLQRTVAAGAPQRQARPVRARCGPSAARNPSHRLRWPLGDVEQCLAHGDAVGVQDLFEQVAVGRVQLNAVEAGFGGQAGCLHSPQPSEGTVSHGLQRLTTSRSRAAAPPRRPRSTGAGGAVAGRSRRCGRGRPCCRRWWCRPAGAPGCRLPAASPPRRRSAH